MEHALKFGGWAPGISRRDKRRYARALGLEREALGLLDRLISWMSGFSVKSRARALNNEWGKATATKPEKVYLALCTTVPTATSTGATIVEATGATGYARKEVPVGNISSATEATPSVIENTAELVFNNITAGSATVEGWSLTDSATTGAGNSIMYGTATSTVISETQTPPTVASGKLKGELT